jgi:hypothetical protein
VVVAVTTVDVHLDTDRWVGVPGEWSEETWPDHRDWAREVAETVWHGATPAPGGQGPDHLALGLAMLTENPLLAEPWRRAFVWLPGPTSTVLPVYLEAYAAEGERDDALRELTRAHEAGAVEKPVVEPFPTEHLGDGLRVLRYAADPRDGAVVLTLSYAWRAADLDVLLWLSTFDTGLALRAVDDVDDFARRIHLVRD